ncbi:MAG: TIGR03089 family protein [Actinomycetes bacterium]
MPDPTPDPTPAALLADAVRRDPSRPLLTFYDDATGERTELSVLTFANWVAKTANLLRDDLDAQPGERATIAFPVHWQAAVWVQACWEVGMVVDLTAGEAAAVAVVTHEAAAADADAVVSLGLGPMGLPRPGGSPSYRTALDYDREVPGHGDRFDPTPGAAVAAGLVVADGALGAADLVAAATVASSLEPGGRLLVTDPIRDLDTVLGTVLVPLASSVTAVLCRHLDPARLPGRVEQEGLVAALGDSGGLLPAWRPRG